MANRLSKIVTRTGDDGTTGICDNQRIGKDGLRIHTIGEVDELNSMIGLLCSEPLPELLHKEMQAIQHDLFDLGGELSMPNQTVLDDRHVARLDELLQKYNADLPALKEFILPGGSRPASLAHVCRAVCRRAERAVVKLAQAEPVNPRAVQYLNRLSDLFFVVARELNRQAEKEEKYWEKLRQQLYS
ncbi:MAG: cob(I)yrinic acid a,c-diamide adenosyltransferase [Burkholderiaceae bacterium]|nr:cob(I)yrinic acid a,c-diamide adenosyltransferase [Burkholderiaceae bacterium]